MAQQWPLDPTVQTAPAGLAEIAVLDQAFANGACRSLYIGVTGHINAVMMDGKTVLFSNVPVGILPIRCTKIVTVSGTATLVVAVS